MKTFYLFILVLLIEHVELFAQNRIGASFDLHAYSQLPQMAPIALGEKNAPLPYKVDLTPYCPPVGDQKRTGSCVAWAASYAAYSISKIREAKEKRKDTTGDLRNWVFSPFYVYNQLTNNQCDEPLSISEVLEFMLKQGTCLYADFEETRETACTIQPKLLHKHQAQYYKLYSYRTLFPLKPSEGYKSIACKYVLARKQPVIALIRIGENFAKVDSLSEIWKPDKVLTDYHALAVVGYDEHRQAFKIMNSYGPSWGRGGFAWIRYNDFEQYCVAAYEIATSSASFVAGTEAISLEVGMHLEFDMSGEKDILTVQGKFLPTEGSYRLVISGDEQSNQSFRLILNHLPNNCLFVYIFSYNSRDGSKWHRPKSFPTTCIGLNPKEKERFIFPSSQEVYNLRASEEYFILLFSTERLDDTENNLHKKLDQFNTSKGEIYQKVQQVWGKAVPPQEEISFEPSRILATLIKRDNVLLPLILKIHGK